MRPKPQDRWSSFCATSIQRKTVIIVRPRKVTSKPDHVVSRKRASKLKCANASGLTRATGKKKVIFLTKRHGQNLITCTLVIFHRAPVARPRRAGGAPPPHHHPAHRPACTFNCESPCCRSASSYESEVVKATHKCGFGLERDRITEPMRATLLSLAPLPSIPQVARREPDVP
jgi:hypothetical protein